MEQTRTCAKCGETKNKSTDFYQSTTGGYCKPCQSAYNIERAKGVGWAQTRTHQNRYDSTARGRMRYYRAAAKRAAAPFELSLAEVTAVLCQPCCLCGSTSRINVRRVYPDVGFVTGNVRPCCPKHSRKALA